jgi:mannitol operon repressor
VVRTNNEASIEKTHPHLKAFGAFLDEMNGESPRGAALTAAAMLDNLLKDIIAAFLIPGEATDALLEGFNAPLGTQSAREKAALAMGLLSDREAREAELIRKVRNEFAHGVHVTFETPKVKALCKKLQMDAKPYGELVWEARSAFTSSAMALILNLTNRPAYVRQKALTSQSWPF